MTSAVVLFNRDLRVHDHPALVEAAQAAESVIPLFVLDDQIIGSPYATPNRVSFLLDCLHDLRMRLRARGADLVVTRGDTVQAAIRIAREHEAESIFVTADVSRFAKAREHRLAQACAEERLAFVRRPGITVVPFGELVPAAGSHYRVFTPYFNAWRAQPWRRPLPAPRRVSMPTNVIAGTVPGREDLVAGLPSPALCRGGETAGRELLRKWAGRSLSHYGDRHDDLAADATSRISPYVHFGCVSPLELATRLRARPGGEPYVRQLCWRDFHHQVTSAFDAIATRDYRSRGDRWRRSARDLAAWKAGRTGYPIVDAGMRQLQREGWMHNRARLIVASFLTKHLYLDWREGAQHFLDWLVDGDIANNSGNWQWVAGTGNDTRPHRVLNPLRQAERFDPDGAYVRRHVTELAHIDSAAVHRPWELDASARRELDYPDPIIDHAQAVARFRAARDR
ncbi:MAG: cryptochrome/photolyase family protein [Acidimicrobiia bacterium]